MRKFLLIFTVLLLVSGAIVFSHLHFFAMSSLQSQEETLSHTKNKT